MECEERIGFAWRNIWGEAPSTGESMRRGLLSRTVGRGFPWLTGGRRTVSRASEITGWRQGAGGLGRYHHRRRDSRCGSGVGPRDGDVDFGRGPGSVRPWPSVACDARNGYAAECRILAAVVPAILDRLWCINEKLPNGSQRKRHDSPSTRLQLGFNWLRRMPLTSSMELAQIRRDGQILPSRHQHPLRRKSPRRGTFVS